VSCPLCSLNACGLCAECNFGYAWYEDEIKDVHTQYRAFTHDEIVADIGLHIGLRGINVTLKGNDVAFSFLFYLCEQACRSIRSKSGSTTTKLLDGLIRGPRDDSASVALQEDSTKNSAPRSLGACPTQFSG